MHKPKRARGEPGKAADGGAHARVERGILESYNFVYCMLYVGITHAIHAGDHRRCASDGHRRLRSAGGGGGQGTGKEIFDWHLTGR